MKKSRKKRSPFVGQHLHSVAYRTKHGRMYQGKSEDILSSSCMESFKEKVNLIFTSPPFPLNRKKKYGNETGERYIDWLTSFGELFKQMLTKDGSIVIENSTAFGGYDLESFLYP